MSVRQLAESRNLAISRLFMARGHVNNFPPYFLGTIKHLNLESLLLLPMHAPINKNIMHILQRLQRGMFKGYYC